MPATATVRAHLGGDDIKKTYAIEKHSGPLGQYAPRLWAAEQIRRMLANARSPDEQRGRVVALGLEYGLITPFTSFLALESEAAYAEMGVTRRASPLRPARLASLSEGSATFNPGSILPLFTGCSTQESSPAAANHRNAAQEGKASSDKEVQAQANEPAAPPAAAEPAKAAAGDAPVESIGTLGAFHAASGAPRRQNVIGRGSRAG